MAILYGTQWPIQHPRVTEATPRTGCFFILLLPTVQHPECPCLFRGPCLNMAVCTSSISKSTPSSLALGHSSHRDHHSGHRWEKPLSCRRETHSPLGYTATQGYSLSGGRHSHEASFCGVHFANLSLPQALLTEAFSGSK